MAPFTARAPVRVVAPALSVEVTTAVLADMDPVTDAFPVMLAPVEVTVPATLRAVAGADFPIPTNPP